MNELLVIVTDELLGKIKHRYYLGGKELKVGDKIIYGYTIGNSGFTSSFYSHSDAATLTLKTFVYDEDKKVLIELYKLNDNE